MTLFNDGPDVLVDISNVCRDQALLEHGERASWKIFEDVVKAMDRAPIQLGRVYAVADRSLYPILGNYGREQLKTFRKKGLLEETALADERLIGYLFDDDSPFDRAVVLSRDMFDDFRRSHPQIQESKELFLEWRGDTVGLLSIHFRNMQFRTHRRISRKIEEGEMKARKLFRDTIRERAMESDFRCDNSDCVVAQLWADRLRELPVYERSRDTFVCPSCGSDLTRLSRRSPTAQLVVYHDGEEQMRLLLEEGDSVEVGRTDAKGCVGLSRQMSKDTLSSVSRKHLKFTMRNGTIRVADLDTKNGTRLKPRRRGEARRLEPNRAVTFDDQLRLLLPGDITIEMSGQVRPFEGDRPITETIAAPRTVLETMIDLG